MNKQSLKFSLRSNYKKVSVIMVTYNSGEYIGSCLKSIEEYIKLPHEIIIADNKSADNTLDVIKQSGVAVKLLSQEKNLGFSRANNLAVSKAEGEYLFFLNPDMKILDNKIYELVDYLEAHRDTAIAAPKLIDERGAVQPSVQRLPTLGGALAQYLLGSKEAYQHYAPSVSEPIAVESVVGGAMMISKKIYEGSGGFDNKYFMYFEDLDLCRKLRKSGWKIVYMPKVKIKHKIGGSAATNPQVSKYIQESFVIYHGPITAALLNFIHQLIRIRNFIWKKSGRVV